MNDTDEGLTVQQRRLHEQHALQALQQGLRADLAKDRAVAMEVLHQPGENVSDVLDALLVLGAQPIDEILQVRTNVSEVLPGEDVETAVADDGQGLVLRRDGEEVDVLETRSDAVGEENLLAVAFGNHFQGRQGLFGDVDRGDAAQFAEEDRRRFDHLAGRTGQGLHQIGQRSAGRQGDLGMGFVGVRETVAERRIESSELKARQGLFVAHHQQGTQLVQCAQPNVGVRGLDAVNVLLETSVDGVQRTSAHSTHQMLNTTGQGLEERGTARTSSRAGEDVAGRRTEIVGIRVAFGGHRKGDFSVSMAAGRGSSTGHQGRSVGSGGNQSGVGLGGGGGWWRAALMIVGRRMEEMQGLGGGGDAGSGITRSSVSATAVRHGHRGTAGGGLTRRQIVERGFTGALPMVPMATGPSSSALVGRGGVTGHTGEISSNTEIPRLCTFCRWFESAGGIASLSPVGLRTGSSAEQRGGAPFAFRMQGEAALVVVVRRRLSLAFESLRCGLLASAGRCLVSLAMVHRIGVMLR